MCPEAPTRKLAAILSGDVVGYSRLMAEDEDATVRGLAAYREEIELLVRQQRGRVVDFTGDNFLAEFPTATDAVTCAVEVQGVLKVRNAPLPADRRLEFRMGVHLGEVRVENDRLYGDGVNIAARLEAMADPGGICISSTVQDQVDRKVDLGFEDLGDQPLKNIPKPVRVFRVRMEPSGVAPGENLPGMQELTVPGFGDRPAIAVLPFDNLSGDPEQEYFADGIAEDLITRLSAWRGFPVIARNSSFIYKGNAVDVKRVRRELGVRYVIEGSVRKAGGRVRITAQLIDATTGGHIWAERYDRELRDVFVLQDEITEAVVASMHPELERFELERTMKKDPGNLDAWELAQRGTWHLLRLTREDSVRARSLFGRATELDPSMSKAFSGIALSHFVDLGSGWSESPTESLSAMLQAAQRGSALDEKDSSAHVALEVAYSISGENEKAIAAGERALQLNPSSAQAHAYLALALARFARAEEAIASAEKAMRLSPQDPDFWQFLWIMAEACFSAGRYTEAVDWAHRSLQRRPDQTVAQRFLAASYAHLGRLGEARSTLESMLRLAPTWTMASARMIVAGAHPDFRDRLLDGLRKAGLPEE